MQLFDRCVNFITFGDEAIAKFAGQSARAGDSELAGVAAGAGNQIGDRSRARLGQADVLQILIQRRDMLHLHPAQNDILLDGGAGVIRCILMNQVSQLPHLHGREIAQWQRDGHRGIARLSLFIDIGRLPFVDALGLSPVDRQRNDGQIRSFLVAGDFVEMLSPRWIFRHGSAFFENDFFELLDAELLHDEFQASLLAIFLFAKF